MLGSQTEPLHQAHDTVDASAHVVCREAANEGVEGWGGWADSEEEGDFDEDEGQAGETKGHMLV